MSRYFDFNSIFNANIYFIWSLLMLDRKQFVAQFNNLDITCCLYALVVKYNLKTWLELLLNFSESSETIHFVIRLTSLPNNCLFNFLFDTGFA